MVVFKVCCEISKLAYKMLMIRKKRACQEVQPHCRCVTNFKSYCPDGSGRTVEDSQTRPAGPDQYRTPKVVTVKPSLLLSHLCYQAVETLYASCHGPIRYITNALS